MVQGDGMKCMGAGFQEDVYTEKWHNTVIDAPGHQDSISPSQADAARIILRTNVNFTTINARGDN